ncbi:hypothetical protein [Aequorivita echinoideorum]|uniref:Uncharacterized protein n=1 Tax=Aequorivita echinoideorum TaxID=1549647 RepID=A0ABS5S0T8_9FLAO|nr:hypothetical protein [Aequorivita echinoideorum]MBT0606833.1 hypothetical protein [Aequorivita echinoideorum]
MNKLDIFPPLWKFVFAAKMTEQERFEENIDLQALYYGAKKSLKKQLENSFDDISPIVIKEKIEFVENELLSFGMNKPKERKMIVDILDYLKTFTNDEIKAEFSRDSIFRNMESELFFIETLKHLNVLDANGKAKRGFQAACDAIKKSNLYKDNIFCFNFKLQDYIKYLNERFEAGIKSDNRLSDGIKYEEEVDKFFKLNPPKSQ